MTGQGVTLPAVKGGEYSSPAGDELHEQPRAASQGAGEADKEHIAVGLNTASGGIAGAVLPLADFTTALDSPKANRAKSDGG
eukprot:5115655-Lingulodinium_polyedra.AAC.1